MAVFEVVATEYGAYPDIVPLNPMLSEGATLLKLTVRVHWQPDDAALALRQVERQLADVVPGLSRHQCRGPHQYRLLGNAQGVIEAELALAHLFEHVMIDAVAFVTGAPRISGVTGARADAGQTFDVFVECPDRAVALMASQLGLAWVEVLVSGQGFDREPGLTLSLARELYRAWPGAVDPERAALYLRCGVRAVVETLDTLTALGFAREDVASLNLSGVRQFRFAQGRN